MKINILTLRNSINKAYLKVKPNRTRIETFKKNIKNLFDQIKESESEIRKLIQWNDFCGKHIEQKPKTMRKSIFLFCTLILILISCKKEEYIKHDSQIFINDNAQIIGTWHYLFTISGGGYVGSHLKTIQDLPDLKIDPYGNYEKFKGSDLLLKGVIDTIKTIQNVLYVKFYPYGIKTSIYESPSLTILNSDTLLIMSASGDTYKSEHYKRN